MTEGTEKKKKKSKSKDHDKKKEKRTVGNYILSELLGRGGFGAVYKGTSLDTGEIVALKQVSLKKCDKEKIDNIHGEINLLKKLNHDRIVKYIDHKQSKTKLYIIMELMESGSLLDLCGEIGPLNEKLIAHFTSQVLEGLEYLHSEGVIHRDIKGANILKTKSGEIKLADFGVASTLQEADGSNPVGTPYWMAPEIIELNPATPASDVWSVGATVIELLTGGEPPYFTLDPMPALYRIVEDEHPPLPPKISPACKDFLLKCFQKDPNLRNSATQLLKHVWIKNAIQQRNSQQGDHLMKQLSTRMSIGITVPVDPRPQSTVQTEAIKQNLKKWNEDEEEENWPELPDINSKITRQSSGIDHNNISFRITDDDVPTLKLAPPSGTPRPQQPIKKAFSDEDSGGWSDGESAEPAPRRAPLKLESSKKTFSDEDSGGWSDGETPEPRGPPLKLDKGSHQPINNNNNNNNGNKSQKKTLNDFVDRDDDDLVDDFGDLDLTGDNLAEKLIARMESTNLDDIDNDEDVFQDILESSFGDIEIEANPMEQEQLRLEKQVSDLISKLNPDGDEKVQLEACHGLVEIFKQHPQMKSKLTQHHGVLPIMDMLGVEAPDVILATLQLVNHLTNDYDIQYLKENIAFRETLCLVGALPQVMRFSNPSYSVDIRKQACIFISAMCNTSALTLQMFIACRGLPVLVEFLIHDNRQHFEVIKDMIYNAIDAVMQVFNIPEKKTRTPKNDFCRLFSKCNLMSRLSDVMLNLTISNDPQSHFYLDKVMSILLLFSDSDSSVKARTAQPGNLNKFFNCLENLPPNHKLNMIKCIKNLALDPSTFANFESSGAIARLVGLLSLRQNDFSNQIISALFSLCRVNKERQEKAALAGIIPELQYMISSNSPLKHFALNMYCDLAHTGSRTRQLLWQHNGVQFYVKHLMNVNGWQVNALEALREWMTEEPQRVQDELCKSNNVDFMVNVFEHIPAREQNMLNSMLQPLQAMLNASVKMTRVLSGRAEFVKVLKQALQAKAPDVLMRVTQLKIVQSLYKWSEHPKRIMNDLYPVIKNIIKDEKAVLVKELAQSLLRAFEENIKL
ncbi:serine/threonine-protein kinase [Acrasis kona]|uniref:non-specific serine/threonine protein kinase n=1 Tax=Acrasis kona TaxID=1008807 RepID=A0AAW2ZB82_9EUKA